MLTGLTGTPGVGKSAVADVLLSHGLRVFRLGNLAQEVGAVRDYDSRRRSWNIDLAALDEAVPPDRPLVLEGHLAHLLPVDAAVVLRCHPEVLRERLHARGWPSAKVDENVEAEALGVITQEALERVPTWEVDTTHRGADETAGKVRGILEGRTRGCEPGRVDWSEVILSWY